MRLIVEDGAGVRAFVALERDELVIGRALGADVVLAARMISRRHGRLVRHGPSWFVEDLGSSNGIFLGGRRVFRTRVSPGQRLAFGDYRLWLEDEPDEEIIPLVDLVETGTSIGGQILALVEDPDPEAKTAGPTGP